jgi:hypothetical protein
MVELLLDNVDSEVSDEEIGEFLTRYGFPPFDAIEHMPGTGTRPAVLLTFNATTPEALRTLQPRIQNVYWRNHTINAVVMQRRVD